MSIAHFHNYSNKKLRSGLLAVLGAIGRYERSSWMRFCKSSKTLRFGGVWQGDCQLPVAAVASP